MAMKAEALAEKALLDSIWVRRLGRVSFLGSLDYQPDANRPSSRLDHSLGVMRLARQAADAIGLEGERRIEFATAALLHDIGHLPLSHSAEAAFVERLGVGHHAVSEWIILGNGLIETGRSLKPLLESLDLSPERIWLLVSGNDKELGPLLTGSINVDTLDGIPRAARTFGLKPVNPPKNLFHRDSSGLRMAPGAIRSIDRFWQLKERVYETVINRPSNVILESQLTESVVTKLSPAVFETLESFDDARFLEIFDCRLPSREQLREWERNFAFSAKHSDGRIPRQRKRYWIDSTVGGDSKGLALQDWPRRYRHTRQIAQLTAVSVKEQLPLPMETEISSIEAEL